MKHIYSSKLLLFVSVLSLVLIDLLTKFLFYDLKIWNSFLLLTPSFNYGIAWSLPVPLFFVLFVSLVFILVIFLLFSRLEIDFDVAMFLLAGTFWNLYDRVFLLGVRDFIDFHFFPVFNFADMFLTIGILLFLYHEFFWTRIENR